MQTNTPAAAAVVTHDVESFDAWKPIFDGHASARQSAGIVAAHVNRHAENPNRLSIYLAAGDAAKLRAFLDSTQLMTVMRNGGVKGPPHIALITPVEDLTVKDRALAGLILRHEVRDFDAWRKFFDGHAAARKAAGIVGHALNRSLEKPNDVVIYLQAASIDALRAFVATPDLKEVMQTAGVIGAPEFTFVQGGEWAN